MSQYLKDEFGDDNDYFEEYFDEWDDEEVDLSTSMDFYFKSKSIEKISLSELESKKSFIPSINSNQNKQSLKKEINDNNENDDHQPKLTKQNQEKLKKAKEKQFKEINELKILFENRIQSIFFLKK